MYFNEKKNEIFGRKSWLSTNKANDRQVYIKERLPRKQKQITEKAEELGLVTSTQNCNVDERILALENRVAKLEERVDECEKYSSKDCLIFENLPIKKPEGKVPTLKHQVCDFLLKYLNWETPT